MENKNKKKGQSYEDKIQNHNKSLFYFKKILEKIKSNKNIKIMKEGEEKIILLKKEKEKKNEIKSNQNKDDNIKKLNKENKELEDNGFLINQLSENEEIAKENNNMRLENELNPSENKFKIIKKEISEQLPKYYSEYTKKINKKLEEIEKKHSKDYS